MRGYTKPWEPPQIHKDQMQVQCKRCKNTWVEEVTHFGAIAGYARYYDFCDKCITPQEKITLGVKEEK